MSDKMTYTEALEAILDRLPGPREEVEPGILCHRLDRIETDLSELVDLLRQMNGSVKRHSEILAAHSQWIEDREGTCRGMKERIDAVSKKTNIATALTAGLSLIAGALGIGGTP